MALTHKDIEKLFRVRPSNGRVRLKAFDPAWAARDHFRDLKKDALRARAEAFLQTNRASLSAAQEVLWATDRYAVLIVLQAMDAAGKDGTIKHVMSASTRRDARSSASRSRRTTISITRSCGAT